MRRRHVGRRHHLVQDCQKQVHLRPLLHRIVCVLRQEERPRQQPTMADEPKQRRKLRRVQRVPGHAAGALRDDLPYVPHGHANPRLEIRHRPRLVHPRVVQQPRFLSVRPNCRAIAYLLGGLLRLGDVVMCALAEACVVDVQHRSGPLLERGGLAVQLLVDDLIEKHHILGILAGDRLLAPRHPHRPRLCRRHLVQEGPVRFGPYGQEAGLVEAALVLAVHELPVVDEQVSHEADEGHPQQRVRLALRRRRVGGGQHVGCTVRASALQDVIRREGPVGQVVRHAVDLVQRVVDLLQRDASRVGPGRQARSLRAPLSADRKRGRRVAAVGEERGVA
mmetsp:Transcript_30493/g.87976  ORF Transcript_30493/g.87976 Transcript_30493/m.87976 type:complete len:335 (+) Transcript_30493:114-1118(+)